MQAPKEVEIKLSVPPELIDKLEEAAPLRDVSGSARVEQLTSVYYDTPGRKLFGNGISLRVRFNGRRRIQTIKADAFSSRGMIQRGERGMAIDGDRPALDAA